MHVGEDRVAALGDAKQTQHGSTAWRGWVGSFFNVDLLKDW